MLEISFGKNRSDTNWKPDYMEWEEFVEILRKVRRTNETMAEYDRMTKNDKDKIKNGRAFVGGLVKGGRRKKENIENRWLITLDADNADDDFLFCVDLILGGTAYAVYSTHSCRPNKLKYRLVCPVNRALSPDEHAAVSRKLADKIGMTYFDKTTFDVHRLMYLPSCSKDATPILEISEGEPVNVEDILNEYLDWRDPEEWPKHPDSEKNISATLQKLGDPVEKPGVIGVFCQVYGMQEGIETFLSEVYSPTNDENRWTYTGGTSFGGMRIYDNAWAYSEHQSDPTNDGHCHNIFDMVRIHKFGYLDADVKEHTPGTKLPSHQAMLEFAANDPEVKRIRLQQDFDEDMEEPISINDEPPQNWESKIKVNAKTGMPFPTAKNAEIILRNGPFYKTLAYDAFGNAEVIRGPLPWRQRERPHQEYEPWLGADDKRMLHYFGKKYEFKATATIQNAFTEVVHKNTFHPIKEYLGSCQWDGVNRLEEIFITYLGAEDSRYVRTVTRKMLIAAVKRLYEPGCKFDYMLVLVGPQGAGKSSLLAKLGRKWFSDSLRNFENKEAGEHLQGAWIFELGELSAMKKSELEEVKAFLSKTEDRYRVAYDRQVSEFPRKCIFFGTTNNHNFLQDPTGNRRFWPVDVDPDKRKLDHWDYLKDEEIGQIWAEALTLYKAGESLELDKKTAREAERMQGIHTETDPREGLIQRYLETKLPADWDEKDVWERRNYLEEPTGDIPRTRVCAAEIWAEALRLDPAKFGAWEARPIYDILRKLPDWKERKGRLTFKLYGKQTTYEKIGQ
ncbi:virulence-associated E family protein [Ruminiclostridium cellulolyticum]|uniref:Virulence-associated E family protein n=1 Tax=Ruminiclostridium cellulolyticum (strain ATCC 35319 / DSM 5812 / JCM 6584 / H10) TaxID=394503 RepID=B8I917_RUMCH|nr:virulence-associated E family protein [Ruminiclostridium cellulolyticum]ACL77349.1 virulence-associated E family protein [Ruminiclostridium cellulolyticum H10]